MRSKTGRGAGHHLLIACCWAICFAAEVLPGSSVDTNAAPHFNVTGYAIDGNRFLPADTMSQALSKYTGTNVAVDVLVQAASEVLAHCRERGYPTMGVVIGEHEITNGIVKLHVVPMAISQIVVSGTRYLSATNLTGITSNRPPAEATANAPSGAGMNAAAATAATAPVFEFSQDIVVSPNAMDHARQTLRQEIATLDFQERRTRLLPNSKTNFPVSPTSQTFEVKGYELIGNTVLPRDVTDLVFQPFVGPRKTFDHVKQALADLTTVYRDRGYSTVSVGLPPQKLTNGIVKVRVFEGLVTDILMVSNRYFSSNNIMRALPGLHTNMLLVSQLFQAELDRANANQDRQIYPELQPGPEENTSLLRLNVKDRLPLHAKTELNNQSSPGTPELRINSSAVYDNLWQHEHSLGVQYSFSPEDYKTDTPANDWAFYNRPQVATYSAFYRVPLGSPGPIANDSAAGPGSFGYDEATRQFRLPPPSSRPELNFYGNGATIDTRLETTFTGNLYDTNGSRLDRTDLQQDITKNYSFGSRLSLPLRSSDNLQSGFSGGFDYKTYDLASYKTNVFTFTTIQIDNTTSPPTTNVVTSVVNSPVAPTLTHLEYLPLSLRYDASLRDPAGVTFFGLGVSVNAWHSGDVMDVQKASGSPESKGHWVTVTPSLSRDFPLFAKWVFSFHGEGQWASEPLISNEQFGIGGVANVRGYREGEVFGDTGWHLNLELKMPPHVTGVVYHREAFTIRPSVYMDYGRVYLLDPQGRPPHTSLWGTGFGAVATIGAHWEGRFLFSWPLLDSPTTQAYQPRFNFSLTAQF
jgi:hemolysin activation/secretion protein